MSSSSLYIKFFTPKEAGKYACNICGALISGSVGKVSNISKHLRTVHKDHRDAATTRKMEEMQTRQSRLGLTPFGELSSMQPPLKKESAQHMKITKCLIQAVADGYLPMAVVDRASFRNLVHSLNPRYNMPRRKSLRSGILSEGKDSSERRLALLQRATTVTVTMDLWSNRRMHSFMGETAHFITEQEGQLTMNACLLTCRRFEDRHTAANIAWHHQAVLADNEITSKVVVAVTDSAANMKKAFTLIDTEDAAPAGTASSDEDSGDEAADVDDLDPDDELTPVSVADVLDTDNEAARRPVTATRVACACHTLQLAVRDGLKALPNTVTRSVGRVNSFVASVKRSTVAAEIMERRKAHVHVTTVTRWNSQLRCIESYLALTPETLEDLSDAVPAIAAKIVDDAGRRGLTDLVEILTPLAEATLVLQKEKEPTGSSVLPTVRILRLRLAELAELTSHLSRVAKKLLESVNERFAQFSSPLFMAATFLDPRWKLPVLSPSHVERVQMREQVEDELVKYLCEFPPPEDSPGPGVVESPALPSVNTTSSIAAAVPEPSARREGEEPPAKRGFFDLLDDEEDQPPPAPLTLRQRMVAEMDSYAREPRENRELVGRALAYWSGQRTAKPLLRHCSLHFLAVPASSAPSERLFSIGGRFFCPSRSRLTPLVFESLMCIKGECM